MKRKIWLIPLALLLAVSLVSCAAPAPAPAPAPASAPAPALKGVRLGMKTGALVAMKGMPHYGASKLGVALSKVVAMEYVNRNIRE